MDWDGGNLEIARIQIIRIRVAAIVEADNRHRRRENAVLGSRLSGSSARCWRTWIRWCRRNRDGHGEDPLRGVSDSIYRQPGDGKNCLANFDQSKHEEK
jgi:hypothetical protein